MLKIRFSSEEIEQTQDVVRKLVRDFPNYESNEFLDISILFANELPYRIRHELIKFRVRENHGSIIFSGIPINNELIGHTPKHWSESVENTHVKELEMLLLLLGSLLGEIFGWATQQNGKIIHNILPIKGHEKEQLGSSSEELLWWHTEDAFHPYRSDYLGLLCMRNPDHVPTTYACIDDLEIDEKYKKSLLEEKFIIKPDNSHKPSNNNILNEGYFNKILEMEKNPNKVPVLFGNPSNPYLRLDPFFMEQDMIETRYKDALNHLVEKINTNLQNVILEPGDIFFIDNYKCVHGRKPFYARYDGNDRWLKRICITRNLRYSTDSREKASRLVY